MDKLLSLFLLLFVLTLFVFNSNLILKEHFDNATLLKDKTDMDGVMKFMKRNNFDNFNNNTLIFKDLPKVKLLCSLLYSARLQIDELIGRSGKKKDLIYNLYNIQEGTKDPDSAFNNLTYKEILDKAKITSKQEELVLVLVKALEDNNLINKIVDKTNILNKKPNEVIMYNNSINSDSKNSDLKNSDSKNNDSKNSDSKNNDSKMSDSKKSDSRHVWSNDEFDKHSGNVSNEESLEDQRQLDDNYNKLLDSYRFN
jgi:hypothetical protein